MTKKYYDRIVKWTFKILTKTFELTDEDARLYQVLPNPKHRFFDRKPKRMMVVEGKDRSMLVIEAEQHQIQEIKSAYNKAGIFKDRSEEEEYVLRDIDQEVEDSE